MSTEELTEPQRYATAGLMTIAFAEVRRNPCGLLVMNEQSPSSSSSSPEEDLAEAFGRSQYGGLARHVYSHFHLPDKVWRSLEEMAASDDFKLHLGALLAVLSDDSSNSGMLPGPSNGANRSPRAPLSPPPPPDANSAVFSAALRKGKAKIEQFARARSSRQPSPQPSPGSSGRNPGTGLGLPSLAPPPSEEIEAADGEISDPTKDAREEALSDAVKHALPFVHPMGVIVSAQRKAGALWMLLEACITDSPDELARQHGLQPGYDARERVALRLVALWLGVEWKKVAAMEIMISNAAYEALMRRKAEDELSGALAEAEAAEANQKKWAKWKRRGYIGGAAMLAGTAIAITGGLAAPAIAAGLAAVGASAGAAIPAAAGVTAAFATSAALLGTTAGSVAVAGSFGAAGAGLAGYKMARRTADVNEFNFSPIGNDHRQGRLAVTIMVSGLIEQMEDFTGPWDDGKDSDSERFGLVWESKELKAVTTALIDMLTKSFVKNMVKQGAMLTVLASLVAAVAWPAYLLTGLDYIDGVWAIALDRTQKAGVLLAQALLQQAQGGRPVTLIGFSLGARLIFTCLEELAKKGDQGNIVERVVLLGAPIKVEKETWQKVRKVVAGRFVNGYSKNDWTIGIVYRASLYAQQLAGVSPVDVPGIENIDLTDLIKGHGSYLTEIQEIMSVIDLDSYYAAFP